MSDDQPSSEHCVQGYVAGGSGYDILTLLGVATDIYSKLNYDDTDCQKKIICEFMEEPEMFGEFTNADPVTFVILSIHPPQAVEELV